MNINYLLYRQNQKCACFYSIFFSSSFNCSAITFRTPNGSNALISMHKLPKIRLSFASCRSEQQIQSISNQVC